MFFIYLHYKVTKYIYNKQTYYIQAGSGVGGGTGGITGNGGDATVNIIGGKINELCNRNVEKQFNYHAKARYI